MTDNRFLNVYNEYKNEQKYETSNRFSCLKEQEQKQDSNRFNCLRVVDIQYDSRLSSVKHTYESVNSRMRQYRETKTITSKEPRESVKCHNKLKTTDCNEFPDLVRNIEVEKLAKEMITNPIILPQMKTITVMTFKDGKYTQKDIYEDGSEVGSDMTVKRAQYNSWASVLKS
jgi:hypothetical protein